MNDEPTVNIVIHQGELDHPEVTGAKIIRKLRAHPKTTYFLIEVDGRDPKPITSGDQQGREL